jgi:hypothetical protein
VSPRCILGRAIKSRGPTAVFSFSSSTPSPPLHSRSAARRRCLRAIFGQAASATAFTSRPHTCSAISCRPISSPPLSPVTEHCRSHPTIGCRAPPCPHLNQGEQQHGGDLLKLTRPSSWPRSAPCRRRGLAAPPWSPWSAVSSSRNPSWPIYPPNRGAVSSRACRCRSHHQGPRCRSVCRQSTNAATGSTRADSQDPPVSRSCEMRACVHVG